MQKQRKNNLIAKILKKGGDKMKKSIGLFLFGLLLSIGITTSAFAIATDHACVIVKCTATVSVDVLDNASTAYFLQMEGNGINQTTVSVSAVQVQNNSNGAICKWRVYVNATSSVTALQYWTGTAWDAQGTDPLNQWGLSGDDNNGVNLIVLKAAFKATAPAADDFGSEVGNDILAPTTSPGTDYDYSTGDGKLSVTGGYSSDYQGSGTINCVNPTGAGTGNPTRNLWFCIKTPTAVTNDAMRRAIVTVDATLAGNTTW